MGQKLIIKWEVYLRVPNTVRYLDSMGFKYTKSDLEMIVHRQLANLEVLGERIKLLEKQNELLVKYNHKLIEELSDRKPPIPYPKLSRKKISQEIQNLAAED